MCRAVAAAVLGDPMKVKVIPLSSETRFTALSAGEVDMLARTSTWTYSRDTDLKLDFVGVNYYDGQGFMVKKSLNVSSAKELDGATVCIQTGTTTELNLADFFKTNGMTYEPVPLKDNAEAEQQYSSGACDVYTTDASGLAATRATFADACRPHHPAGNHFERAAGSGRPPWRQSVGRHCPLDVQRPADRRRTWHHFGQRHRNGSSSGRQPRNQPSSGHRG